MTAPPLHCDFCGKSQFEVQKLIAGPRSFICNECVDLCCEIIRNGNVAVFKQQDSERRAEKLERLCDVLLAKFGETPAAGAA